MASPVYDFTKLEGLLYRMSESTLSLRVGVCQSTNLLTNQLTD
jgi:hypothetical protein